MAAMKRLRFMLAAVVLLGLAGITGVIAGAIARADDGSAVPSASDKTYNPIVKYTLNDLIRYRMVMKLNVSMESAVDKNTLPAHQMSISTAMNVVIKTIGVKPDGSYVLSERFSNGEISMGGKNRFFPPCPHSHWMLTRMA
jgi:hypothetical protein